MPSDLQSYEQAMRSAQAAYQQAVKQKPATGGGAQLAYLDRLVKLHAEAMTAVREYLTAKFCAGRLSFEQWCDFRQRVNAEEENHQLIHAEALRRMGSAVLEPTNV